MAITFEQAVADFDAAAFQAFEHGAEAQRQDTLRRYPRDRWAQMSVEDYAQGQPDHQDNLCRWIERQTDQMGSIRGGSARKLIIYHQSEGGWFVPPGYANEQEAWYAVREGFLRAFALADRGEWDGIGEIEPLTRGAALVTKVLWSYFPDELLPITSSANLRHFLRVVGREDLASDQTLRTIALNRGLLAELRNQPRLANVSTKALERLLYMRFSPFEGRLVKIAPGHSAEFWDDCLANGYICVGWEGVGDLRRFESKDAYLAAFREAYASEHQREAKLREKADELWLLLDLAVGERIVANRGKKEILGVGTIVSPGYEWNPDRERYNHTLRVEWDTDYAREIPPQEYWGFKTVLPLAAKLWPLILDEPVTDENEPAPPPNDEQPLFPRIADVLERKRQVILYGPPGTGKTWHASGFARWWLKTRNDPAREGELEWVTFHPSYSYEDFVEGFRPALAGTGATLALDDGIFKSMCNRAASDPDGTYLLVIDEINRAHITKVLGELITLIEKDKRGQLSVRLPYSKQSLTVPPNLFLLGTMNTADRSIKMLDTALRRRFGFVELMPDPNLLAGEVGGLRLDDLLAALNQRVAKTAGREKQIGHSFFLSDEAPISDEAEFAEIFRDEIVPLLQEYAVDDYDELAEYLGPKLVDAEQLVLDTEILSDAGRLLEALEEHLLGGGD